MDDGLVGVAPSFPTPCLGDGREPTTVLLETDTDLWVPLFRFEGEGEPVLLVHGASAWSGSFVVPRGESLVDSLLARGHDVWLLDWRGGRNTLERYRGREYATKFAFEHIAEHDLLAAVAHIANARADSGGPRPVNVIGHCVGGALTALAIAQRDRRVHPLRRVVLSTLGLFTRQSWDGVLKAGDLLLERALAGEPDRTTVRPDPETEPWPRAMERGWALWPPGLLPDPGESAEALTIVTNPVFTRLAFMFGRIAMWNRLHESLRTPEALLEQFGRMHLQTYVQCGQCVRRGFIAPFDAPERPAEGAEEARARQRFLDREKFADVQFTLITGSENNLWHRDSIDRMADWLRTIPGQVGCAKHVVRGYGHQDLLWGAGPEQARVGGLYLDGVA